MKTPLLLVMLILILSACASVFSGTHQEIGINANVDSVDVYRGKEFLGRTPVTVSLSRQQTEPLVFRKNGYKTLQASLRTKMNPHIWWNVPFTVLGTTGLSTDYGSGAFYQISPSKIYVKMKPEGLKSSQDHEDIEIFEIWGEQNLTNEKARHQSGLWSTTYQHLQPTRNEK